MNSWKSTELSACAPPLRTFIIGTGSTRAASPPEVAPQRLALLRGGRLGRGRARRRGSRWRPGGPCSACRRGRSARGRARPGRARRGRATASAISPLTLATACVTPLPSQASPPSRSSVASNSPVEAPEGTAARPFAPDRSSTSTSTVGLPRESRIWRAWTVSIWLTVVSPPRAPRSREGAAVSRCRCRFPATPRRGGPERSSPAARRARDRASRRRPVRRDRRRPRRGRGSARPRRAAPAPGRP